MVYPMSFFGSFAAESWRVFGSFLAQSWLNLMLLCRKYRPVLALPARQTRIAAEVRRVCARLPLQNI
jgi:hypothetical protein